MIVDCHYHIFQPWTGPCGHDSTHTHLNYLQQLLCRTVAQSYRARDGAPADTRALQRKGVNTWDGLTDVDFRIGRFGRVMFTVDGEDYYTHYMPVNMQDISASPEMAIAQLAYAGVDHALLQCGHVYGEVTEYNAFAQAQYPDKLTGLINIEEPLANTPEVLAKVDRAYHQLGLTRGIHYGLDSFARYGFNSFFDDSQYDAFWEKVESLGLVVLIGLSPVPDYNAACYAANMVRLSKLMDRFPKLRWHLEMGLPVHYYARGGKWELPDEVANVVRRENFFVEIMFPITWGGEWDYPYPEAQALIRDFRDQFGAETLIWGSDMPNVERYCTFRQSLDFVRRYCTFLSEREMDLVLGRTTAELYGIA